MTKLTTPLFATLAVLSATCQFASAEPDSSFGLAPSAAPQIQPASPADSLPLIPDSVTPAEKPKKGDADTPRGDKTAMAEDKLRKKIELRKARAKAEQEPDLVAIKARALVAKTDFEQRAIFTEYYDKLCDRIAKYDKSLTKEELTVMKGSYAARFMQYRVAPTVDPAIARAKSN